MSGASGHRAKTRDPVRDQSDGSVRWPPIRGAVPNVDGPASRGTGSAGGSQGPPSAASGQGGFAPQGSQNASRRSSVSTQPQPAATSSFTQTGLDPALERRTQFTDTLRNLDLPATAYNINGTFKLPTQFTRRPGLNTTGKPINITVNAYKVAKYPGVKIYQYDIVIGNGAEKRAVISKVWQSKARKQLTGPPMIFDGNKLAWSTVDHGTEQRLMIDLDADAGRESRGDKNTFRLHLRKAKELDLSIVSNYLAGRTQFGIAVGEAINFLDHLLREGPSRNTNLIGVKRSFFTRNGQRADLGGGIEVYRGVYQSMRLAQGQKMVINLDVANTCFYKPSSLVNIIIAKNGLRDPSQLAQNFGTDARIQANKAWISKLTVRAQYSGNKSPAIEWKIKKIAETTANTHRLEWRNPTTNEGTGEMVSVATYFRRRYNVQLQYPDLPLMEMTRRGAHFPLELLHLVEHQRYGAKLDETQTANMIKFAVSPPATRLKAIDDGKTWLNWSGDAILQAYGLKVESQPLTTQARVLPAPGVRFGRNKVEQPGTKGRWDLRGKVFAAGNPQELVSWGIGIFAGRTRLDQAAAQKFAMDLVKQYRGHGGQISNNPPNIINLGNMDTGASVEQLFNSTGNHFKRRPQLLVFVVQDKNSFNYHRIKKSCDCRFGVVSQVLQAAQVQKCNPQYISNVLMKVNAKLGGYTSTSAPAPSSGFKGFAAPTMIIGADVSHAAPGSDAPSMAAVTVSFDKVAARYVAACQTNGSRVEMITEKNWNSMLEPLATQWCSQVGGGNLPSQIYYMRDGVSEGQFAHVIEQEVAAIRGIMRKIANGKGWNGKLTVVVASKRHHIRAFPRQGDGDQKGNPLPGTLIEQDVTMPNEWDFYLYSHIALQGTSRPVHYTVILDEANHQPNALQNMIYEQCYQYMRSTTSVSLHPAVYYAHLASNRAAAHVDISSTSGQRSGPGFKQNVQSRSDASESEPGPLLPLNNVGGISFSMWYI